MWSIVIGVFGKDKRCEKIKIGDLLDFSYWIFGDSRNSYGNIKKNF